MPTTLAAGRDVPVAAIVARRVAFFFRHRFRTRIRIHIRVRTRRPALSARRVGEGPRPRALLCTMCHGLLFGSRSKAPQRCRRGYCGDSVDWSVVLALVLVRGWASAPPRSVGRAGHRRRRWRRRRRRRRRRHRRGRGGRGCERRTVGLCPGI